MNTRLYLSAKDFWSLLAQLLSCANHINTALHLGFFKKDAHSAVHTTCITGAQAVCVCVCACVHACVRVCVCVSLRW